MIQTSPLNHYPQTLPPLPKLATSITKRPVQRTTTASIQLKMSNIARLRFTIYASLVLSMVMVSYWYNYRSISYTNIMNHPQWNAVLPTEVTVTTTLLRTPPPLRKETVLLPTTNITTRLAFNGTRYAARLRIAFLEIRPTP